MQPTTPTRHAPWVTIIGLGRMGERHPQTCIDLDVEINAVIDTDPTCVPRRAAAALDAPPAPLPLPEAGLTAHTSL